MMVQSSDSSVAGVVYSYNCTPIVYVFDVEGMPDNSSLPEYLFPLSVGITPSQLDYLNSGQHISTGPFLVGDSFYLSITRAVPPQLSNNIDSPGDMLGYITLVSKATALLSVVRTTDLEDESSMFLIKLYTNFTRNGPALIEGQHFEYSYVTPNPICPNCLNSKFPISPSSPEYAALVNKTSGAMVNYKFPNYGMVSTGYAPVKVSSQVWGVVVFQRHKYVYGPITNIQHISIISVFSIGAGVCVLTFLLSGWVLRPITRLQAATEQSFSNPRHTSGFWCCSKRIFVSITSSFKKPGCITKDNTCKKSEKTLNEQGWISDYNKDMPVPKLPETIVSRKYIYDELTELTETFNDTTAELRKQYKLLEERVEERKKEIRLAKNLAETANEAKSLFIANITHELRTPLNGILGMASVAMEDNDPQSVRESLKVIFKSGELLLRLLTDLLSFSKGEVDNDNMKLELKGFFISEIVSQLHAIFDENSKASKIKFSISMTSEWLSQYELSGDMNRILQVVINLVSNSLKFTPPDGFVKVIISATKNDTFSENYENDMTDDIFKNEKLHTETSTGTSEYLDPDTPNINIVTVSFNVCDSGAGIAPHLQSRVFEPFVQGEIGAKETRSGAGLGLSICHHLATLMNGTIDLESEVGMGSCFTFTIPMEYTVITNDSNEKIENKFWNFKSEDAQLISLASLDEEKLSGINENDKSAKEKTNVAIPETVTRETNDPKKEMKEKHEETNHFEVPSKTHNIDNDLSMSQNSTGRSEKVNPNLNSPTTKGITDSATRTSGNNTSNNNSESRKSGSAKELLDHNICAQFRVLIAEDNKVNQEVMLKMLRLEGIKGVEVAKDGLEAVEAVSKSKKDGAQKEFDVILMDIQMPNLDGIQATEYIRQELDYTGPIIAVSAYTDESNIDRCRLAGMNDFLAKPIKRTQLRSILGEFMKKQETASE